MKREEVTDHPEQAIAPAPEFFSAFARATAEVPHIESEIVSCRKYAQTDLLSPHVSHSRIKEEEPVSHKGVRAMAKKRIVGLMMRFHENDDVKIEKRLKRYKKLRKKGKV